MGGVKERKDIYIGEREFSTARLERQERALRAQADEALAYVSEKEDQRREFAEVYGEDLLNYSEAFVRMDPDTGFTRFRLQPHYTRFSDRLETYSKLLMDRVSAVPDELRGEWYSQYLRDIDTLRG